MRKVSFFNSKCFCKWMILELSVNDWFCRTECIKFWSRSSKKQWKQLRLIWGLKLSVCVGGGGSRIYRNDITHKKLWRIIYVILRYLFLRSTGGLAWALIIYGWIANLLMCFWRWPLRCRSPHIDEASQWGACQEPLSPVCVSKCKCWQQIRAWSPI